MRIGVGGTCTGFEASNVHLPFDNYIPAAVFGSASAFDIYAQTANFGPNQDSFLGPTEFPDQLDGFTLGWPNPL